MFVHHYVLTSKLSKSRLSASGGNLLVELNLDIWNLYEDFKTLESCWTPTPSEFLWKFINFGGKRPPFNHLVGYNGHNGSRIDDHPDNHHHHQHDDHDHHQNSGDNGHNSSGVDERFCKHLSRSERGASYDQAVSQGHHHRHHRHRHRHDDHYHKSTSTSSSSSANIFLGQSEAPLMIRPYLKVIIIICIAIAYIIF